MDQAALMKLHGFDFSEISSSQHSNEQIKVLSADKLASEQKSRRLPLITAIVLAILVACLTIVLGVVFGLKHAKSNQSSDEDVNSPSSASNTASSGMIDGGHGGGYNPSNPGSAAVFPVVPDITSCSTAQNNSFISSGIKWNGINLGNWLILERWMNPSYYGFYVPSADTDEWSFCQTLGKQCGPTLEKHWQEWVNRTDIASVSDLGFNLLRIPIGFWAFIDPLPAEPYYKGSQLQNVDRVLSYAQEFNLSVILDLHGLPGSQNGLEHSGQLGPITFFNSSNQARSLDMLDAVLAYVKSSAYKTQIVALEVANEPNVYDASSRAIYKTYLKNGFKKLQDFNQKESTRIVFMFHDGFIGADQYADTFSACDPVVVDYHQYFFNSGTIQAAAQRAMCIGPLRKASPFPLFYGEWSLASGFSGGNATYRQEAFESQAKIYSNSSGSAFWSFKAYNVDGSAQDPTWSVGALASEGAVSNATWDFKNVFC